MTDLSDKFSDLQSLLTTQHTETTAQLNDVLQALGAPPTSPTTTLDDLLAAIQQTNNLLSSIYNTVSLISTNLETFSNNSSLNAQQLLTAIINTACACDTTAPFTPLPLDTTPFTPEEQAKCRRVQFFIDMYLTWNNHLSIYLNSGAMFTQDVPGRLLAEILATENITTGELYQGVPSSTASAISISVSHC